jgi:hypothetical protein
MAEREERNLEEKIKVYTYFIYGIVKLSRRDSFFLWKDKDVRTFFFHIFWL